MSRTHTKKMTHKVTSDAKFARWPQLTLTLNYPPHAPMETLEIRATMTADGGEVQVSAYGLIAKAVGSVSEARFMRAWRKIVEQGGLELPDRKDRKGRKDKPAGKVEVKWEHGKHRFRGQDLALEGPYRAIVHAIESIAGATLKKVEKGARNHDAWMK